MSRTFSDRSHGFRTSTRLPHRAAGNPADLDRGRVVHRGRYLRLFRVWIMR